MNGIFIDFNNKLQKINNERKKSRHIEGEVVFGGWALSPFKTEKV